MILAAGVPSWAQLYHVGDQGGHSAQERDFCSGAPIVLGPLLAKLQASCRHTSLHCVGSGRIGSSSGGGVEGVGRLYRLSDGSRQQLSGLKSSLLLLRQVSC